MTKHQKTLVVMGLGANSVITRQTRFIEFLNKRRPLGAQIVVFPTNWQTTEKYTDKKARLSAFIKVHPNIRVVYGISAGASLAMTLVPEMNRHTKYCFVSGKLRGAQSIGSGFKLRAPALYDSVIASESIIADHPISTYDMHCHVGFLDGVLDQKDMRAPSIPVHRIPMINHSATIVLAYATVLRTL